MQGANICIFILNKSTTQSSNVTSTHPKSQSFHSFFLHLRSNIKPSPVKLLSTKTVIMSVIWSSTDYFIQPQCMSKAVSLDCSSRFILHHLCFKHLKTVVALLLCRLLFKSCSFKWHLSVSVSRPTGMASG